MSNTDKRLREALTDEQVFALYITAGWEPSNRGYLTDADASILASRLRKFASLAAPETGDKILREALAEAIEDIESWASYADTYFQKKHDLAGCLAKHRAILSTGAKP